MKKLAMAFILGLSSCVMMAQAEPLDIIAAASEKQLSQLPIPNETFRIPKKLTLQDAILLALRNNPDVQSSQLQRILDKYALELAYYSFEPQFQINGNTKTARGEQPSTTLNGQTTINSTFGTGVTMNAGYSFNDRTSAQSLAVTQHLLRGFGAVNLIPLENAKTNEEIAKLNFKNSLITVVALIISDYYTLVQDYNNLDTQMLTLNSQQQIVDQYKLQVKVGKMARSDLLQQQSTLATTKLSTQEQKNTLEQDYQTLLNDIGISPTVKFDIDQKIRVASYVLPNEEEAITMALAGNISYQQALLSYQISVRAVQAAENEQKWILDASGATNLTKGQIDEGSPSLELDLSIPIDDVSLKSDLVSAKVALMQNKLSLQNQRRALISTTINNLTQLRNQLQTINLDQNAVNLLSDSLHAEEIKLKYGKSTVFNVTQLQNQVLSQQIDLIDQQITYVLNISTFEQLLGQLLDKWNIQVKYYSYDTKERHNFFRY